jgi:putative peptidoglycan lipid II flippase
MTLALNASSLLSFALLAGRLSGFARDILLAASFGLSTQADIAILVLTLPDLLVGILLSGGLSVALIPALRKLSVPMASALFFQSSLIVFLSFSIFAWVLAVNPNLWVTTLAPGIPTELIKSQSSIFVIVSLALPLAGLAGVTTAYHNANDRFLVAGLGTLFFNIVVVFSLIFGSKNNQSVQVLAVGVILGSLLRWLSQLFTLHWHQWQTIKAGILIDKNLIKAFVAAATSASLILVVPVAIRAMASSIGVGQIAAFNYATKLVELPVGVLITTVSTVLYPHLCELYSNGEYQLAQQKTCQGLQRSILLSVVILIPGIWFMDSIVNILLVRGKLDSVAAVPIVQLTRIALLGVPLVAISSLATTALNASNRTGTVLRIALLSIVLLPAIAWFGLMYKSPLLLMFSIVLHTTLQALLLSRSARIRIFGAGGWLTKKLISQIALLILLISPSIAIDYFLHIGNHWVRLSLMIVTFAMAFFTATRFSKNSIVLS